jgi:hypothetical protein
MTYQVNSDLCFRSWYQTLNITSSAGKIGPSLQQHFKPFTVGIVQPRHAPTPQASLLSMERKQGIL